MVLGLLQVPIQFSKNKVVPVHYYMIQGWTSRTLTTLYTRHTLRQDYVLIDPYPQSPLRIHHSHQNPILLLYGWLNAGDRPFGKYIDLYRHLGYRILAHIPPSSMFLLPKRQPDYVDNMFRNLISTLSILSLNGHQPTIDVHVLSNNGFYQFAALYQILKFQSVETASRCRKIIVDSAPSHLDLSIFVRGFSLALSVGNATLDSILATLLKIYFSSLGIRSASSNRPQHPLISEFHHMIRDQPLQCPHLFLYSDTDSLVPKHDVESYANHLRQHGIDVTEHMFHGSEHVSHYRSFPQEYIALVSQFLK
jgi:pimeloyl-ACP methyl ester carboxylesterase